MGRNCWLKQYSYFILLQPVMWTSWKTSSFTTLLRLGTFRGYEPKLSSLCITFPVSYPARYCGNWRHSVSRIEYCFATALRWKKPIPLKRLLVQKRRGTLAKHIWRKLFFLSHIDNIWKAFSSFIPVRQKCSAPAIAFPAQPQTWELPTSPVAQGKDPVCQHPLPFLYAESKLGQLK